MTSLVVGDKALDQEWLSYLNNPPSAVLKLTETLQARADSLVKTLLSENNNTISNFLNGDIDVVCSGGGNLDAYYLGGMSILNRVAVANAEQATLFEGREEEITTDNNDAPIKLHRYAGASAGSQMSFELKLKGETNTFHSHLSYGFLEDKYRKSDYWNYLSAAALQDHHWRLMIDWLLQKYNATYQSRLDNQVYMALSCLTPLPTLVVVSNYTSEKQAASAFIGTGTTVEWYNGHLCSDGGSMSGKKMTPLFQDNLRSQLIFDIMSTGFPSTMAFSFNTTQYTELIERGQDEMIEFLSKGVVSRNNQVITLCPRGSDVSKNVCNKK